MKIRVVITLTFCALLAFAGNRSVKVNKQPKKKELKPFIVQTDKIGGLNKAEMQKLLAQIENAKAPEAIMDVVNDEPAALPDHWEYVCPTCGEKTGYAKEIAWQWAGEVESCRRLLKEIPNREAISLDETRFCKKCQPGAKIPTLLLRVHFDDGTTRVVPGVKCDDLLVLKGFLSGGLAYQTLNQAKLPLKNKVTRLRQLLGFQDE